MAEYIKKEYAVDAVLDVYCDTPDIDLSCEKFEAAILKIQAADVAPVVHGRWVQCKYMDKSAKCSECGGYYTRFTVNERYPKYCPHCGTNMDFEV